MTNRAPDLSDPVELTEVERHVLDQLSDEEIVEFHRGLVRIPSVNPPGDVRAAIDHCEAPLAAAGFAAQRVWVDETMPSLIATYGSGDGPVVAFNSHVDVVPIGERSAWTYEPFGAEIHHGRIYGRGAGDAKGCVAAQVMAGIALARSGVPLKGQLVVNEVADEEIGGFRGTKHIADNEFFKPDYVIVGEQTLNGVAVGEKGGMPTRVRVHGRTSHGALPWEGVNAIEAMAEIIVALRREYYPEIARRTHPYFHPSSAAVTMFEGGVKTNVVPDHAEIWIDRRLVPGERVDGVRAEIREVAERAVANVPGAVVEIDDAWPGGEASLTPEDSDLVKAMVGANRRLGLSETLGGFSMATDGRYFARKGIKTIIYGPGDPKLAHVPDEWVGIDELLQATRAYALAAVALLSAPI